MCNAPSHPFPHEAAGHKLMMWGCAHHVSCLLFRLRSSMRCINDALRNEKDQQKPQVQYCVAVQQGLLLTCSIGSHACSLHPARQESRQSNRIMQQFKHTPCIWNIFWEQCGLVSRSQPHRQGHQCSTKLSLFLHSRRRLFAPHRRVRVHTECLALLQDIASFPPRDVKNK